MNTPLDPEQDVQHQVDSLKQLVSALHHKLSKQEKADDTFNIHRIPQGPGSGLDADKVDGIGASYLPMPFNLIPLGANKTFPASTIPSSGVAFVLLGDVTGTSAASVVSKINGTALGSTTATAGNILVGSGTAWVTNAISGDATLSSVGAVTLANSGVTAAMYGDATHASQITVDAKGRLTLAANVLITGTTPGGSAGGDLGGTYPNPTVVSVADITTGTLGVTHGGTGTATQFTQNSIVFAGASGIYTQDNANLTYTVSNGHLSIGATSNNGVLFLGSSPSASATINLGNNRAIGWRNSANSDDAGYFGIGVGGSGATLNTLNLSLNGGSTSITMDPTSGNFATNGNVTVRSDLIVTSFPTNSIVYVKAGNIYTQDSSNFSYNPTSNVFSLGGSGTGIINIGQNSATGGTLNFPNNRGIAWRKNDNSADAGYIGIGIVSGNNKLNISPDGSTTVVSFDPANGNTIIAGTLSLTGNLVKINNVTTSFPGSQGAALSLLQNDGSGNLSWASSGTFNSKTGTILHICGYFRTEAGLTLPTTFLTTTIDASITIKRITIDPVIVSIGAGTGTVFRLTDGSSNCDTTLGPGATSVTATFSQNYSSGTVLSLKVQSDDNATPPTDVNVVIEYIIQ